MIRQIVEEVHHLSISKIVLGRLRGIRGNSNNNAKANIIINNFWSFNYAVRRFREKAEEYGIEVEEKSEYKTSSECPRCNSENIATKGRLFKCWRWEPRRAMNTLEAGISRLQPWRASNSLTFQELSLRCRDNVRLQQLFL
jgi:IS605 OrfB family transposase